MRGMQLSLVSRSLVSRTGCCLAVLSEFNRATSAWYWVSLHCSVMDEKGFRSKENLPVQSTISVFPLLAQIIKVKYPEENTASSCDKMESQRIPKISESIIYSQQFSIEKFFVHFCISNKPNLQCQSSFTRFKHCKIEPILNELLVLPSGSCTIMSWWNF